MSVSKARTLAARGNHSMAAVEATPEWLFVRIYNNRTGHTLEPLLGVDGCDLWHLTTYDGHEWVLPRAKDALRVTHIGKHPHVRVLRKYFDAIPVSATDVDTVVDVGGFIGEFSRQLAETHGVETLTVEPDRKNVLCLQTNLMDAGRVVEAAAWHSDERTTLTTGVDSSESTTLTLDDDVPERETVEVDGKRLVTICEEKDVRPDLVKIEAEGAEPEVLAGAVDLRAPVVIDVSDERAGESTYTMCDGILQSHGYATQFDSDAMILFGRPEVEQ